MRILILIFLISQINIPLFGEISSSVNHCEGTIEIIAQGTAGPFSVSIESASSQETTEFGEISSIPFLALGLCPDDYFIHVENAYGCITTLFSTLLPCDQIGIESVQNFDYCTIGNKPDDQANTDCDAEIRVNVPPNANYSYIWTMNGQYFSNEQDLLGICELGVYQLSIVTNYGCTIEFDPINLCCCQAENEGSDDEPNDNIAAISCYEFSGSLLTVSGSVTPITGLEGEISLLASGGYSGYYFYNWDGPQEDLPTEATITPSVPGLYCVTVTNGCQSKEMCYLLNKVSCSENSEIALESASVFDDSGQGGGINLKLINPNNLPVSAQWSNGDIGLNVDDLEPGWYFVEITIGTNCLLNYGFLISNCTVDIEQGVDIDFSEASVCGFGFVGTIGININFGSPPYEVQFGKWNGADNYTETIWATNAQFDLIDEDDSYNLKITDMSGNCLTRQIYIPCSCRLFDPLVYGIDRCLINNNFQKSKLVVASRMLDHFTGDWAERQGQLASLFGAGEFLDFQIIWPDGSESILRIDTWEWVNTPGYQGTFIGESEYIIPNDEPDLYCVEIIDPFGCTYQECIPFGPEGDGCITFPSVSLDYAFGNWNNNGSGFTFGYDPFYQVRTGCVQCSYCGPQENCPLYCVPENFSDIAEFEYRPTDIDKPCDGGSFVCPLDPSIEFQTSPGIQGTEFIDYENAFYDNDRNCWAPCACLFPIGTVEGLNANVMLTTNIPLDDLNCQVTGSQPDCHVVYEQIPGTCDYWLICLETDEILGIEPGDDAEPCILQTDFAYGGPICQMATYCHLTQSIIDIGDEISCDNILNLPPCSELLEGLTLDIDTTVILREELPNFFNEKPDRIAVYPNPFQNRLHMQFNCRKERKINIKLLSQLGEEIFSWDKNLSLGTNSFIFHDLDYLPPGLYRVLITGNEKSAPVSLSVAKF